jgi:WD40 repeat protein
VSQGLLRATDWVLSVAFSSDGKHVTSGSHDKTIQIWDVETGQEILFDGYTSRLASTALLPDGKRRLSLVREDDSDAGC